MSNITDIGGLQASQSTKTLYISPEDSNINRFLLDCLPLNDVSFKYGILKITDDLSGRISLIEDISGVSKSVSDMDGVVKVVLDTDIASLYTYGDVRITYGGNWNYGGYPL